MYKRQFLVSARCQYRNYRNVIVAADRTISLCCRLRLLRSRVRRSERRATDEGRRKRSSRGQRKQCHRRRRRLSLWLCRERQRRQWGSAAQSTGGHSHFGPSPGPLRPPLRWRRSGATSRTAARTAPHFSNLAPTEATDCARAQRPSPRLQSAALLMPQTGRAKLTFANAPTASCLLAPRYYYCFHHYYYCYYILLPPVQLLHHWLVPTQRGYHG